ncbi:hypothetical protein [Methylocystis sp. SC2]|uniref:hypothetical protein n=1 Tax=Methylocystis sp. (strain SC2) TaxID=187303 RepID=UPI00027AF038|nr:hypothetical protein [Methylocystis sp. SC2]CCJ07096.1 Hypothetical protein BN69_1645 [Methylocystis sp. SC2]
MNRRSFMRKAVVAVALAPVVAFAAVRSFFDERRAVERLWFDLKSVPRDLARPRAIDVVRALQNIALNGRDEIARVMAAQSLLDRGFGNPSKAQYAVVRIDGEGLGALGAICCVDLKGRSIEEFRLINVSV